MLSLYLLTVVGLVVVAAIDPHDFSRLCSSPAPGGECPAGWRNVGGDCVKFMSGWDQAKAKEVCREERAEYIEFLFLPPVCLVRRETQCQCGRTNIETKTVGGVETEKKEYPWEVRLSTSRDPNTTCGGSIINRDEILTAANCTEGHSVESINVFTKADEELLERVDGEVSHSVCSKREHPDEDIAVLNLCKPLMFSKAVGPVCLPEPVQEKLATLTTSVPATEALIISGGSNSAYIYNVGNPVEVYIPSTGQHCQLPDMPGHDRFAHTMEEMTVCGGYYAPSCLTLIDGTWKKTTTLPEKREYHSSWASPSGVILLGGVTHASYKSSERIQEDGTSVSGFPLEYDISSACAINIGSSMILTGGRSYGFSSNRVSEYSETGFTRDLPRLLESRTQHGCSYFENEEGTKTFLVTGGGRNPLSASTELLVENSAKWIYSGELPTPRWGLSGANIDQRVIMTGGYDGDDLDEILEFKPSSGTWIPVDRMMSAKREHAVSVISTEKINMFC